MADTPLTAKKYVDGIYIPAGLLVFGTFIVKKEWTPFAAILAILLGVWKFSSSRRSYPPISSLLTHAATAPLLC